MVCLPDLKLVSLESIIGKYFGGNHVCILFLALRDVLSVKGVFC
jgi:hypothetical protein